MNKWDGPADGSAPGAERHRWRSPCAGAVVQDQDLRLSDQPAHETAGAGRRRLRPPCSTGSSRPSWLLWTNSAAGGLQCLPQLLVGGIGAAPINWSRRCATSKSWASASRPGRAAGRHRGRNHRLPEQPHLPRIVKRGSGYQAVLPLRSPIDNEWSGPAVRQAEAGQDSARPGVGQPPWSNCTAGWAVSGGGRCPDRSCRAFYLQHGLCTRPAQASPLLIWTTRFASLTSSTRI